MLVGLGGCTGQPAPSRTARYTPVAQQSISPSSASSTGADWVTYSNGAGGFSCQMPAGWVQAEDADRTGAKASSPDGTASETCTGGPVTSDQSLKSLHTRAVADLETEGFTVTQDVSDATTYKVTAESDTTVTVRWATVGTSAFRSLIWEVPIDEYANYQSSIEESITTFGIGQIDPSDG